MALSQQDSIIIGCIVGITILIVFGLILWYFCSNTVPETVTSQQQKQQKTDDYTNEEEYTPELQDSKNDIMSPLHRIKQTESEHLSLLSIGQSTNKILNIDSNNVFANRWADGKGYQFEWNSNKTSFHDQTKQNVTPYPMHRSIAPSPDPNPISNEFPSINTPNEVLIPLTDSDWSLFDQINDKYGDIVHVLYPDDLTRFVQGYQHEVDRTAETCKRIDELLKRGFSIQQYENEWDFEHILDETMPGNQEQQCLKVWPVFMYGYDKQGHPIMYDEIGCSNPADIDRCFDGQLRKLKTFRYRIIRRFQNTKRIQNMRYGYDGSVNDKGGFNCITKQIIVMNMQNFYAKSLTAKYRNLVKSIVCDESNLWPNTLEKMFIVNAPWSFRFAWKIFQKFLYVGTVQKIHILDGNYIETMKEYIDLDQIPKSYGGTGELPIKYGYAADIDNDILDGYYLMNDPIDLNTVSCRKNNSKLNETDTKEQD